MAIRSAVPRRYGFIVGESDMAGRTAGAAAVPGKQRSASQVGSLAVAAVLRAALAYARSVASASVQGEWSIVKGC
jgi:hypothetical protein